MFQSGGEQGVSIIIPTCRESRFTALCLDRVCVSTERMRGLKEVILGVDRPIREDDPLLRLKERYPFVRLVPNPGLPGAPRVRKLALDQARYNVLLFTDDDCFVPGDWVERMTESALAHGVVTGLVAGIEPALALAGRPDGPKLADIDSLSGLWKMEEIIDRYRLLAVDSANQPKYISFPNLAIRRELLPPVPFDSVFDRSADDLDLGYRLRLNGIPIHVDSVAHPVRTAYPVSFVEAIRRKFRHAKGIAYVHLRIGKERLVPLEPGSLSRILIRWIGISLSAPLSWPDRLKFLALNLAYCGGLAWQLLRLRGVREFPVEDVMRSKPVTAPIPDRVPVEYVRDLS